LYKGQSVPSFTSIPLPPLIVPLFYHLRERCRRFLSGYPVRKFFFFCTNLFDGPLLLGFSAQFAPGRFPLPPKNPKFSLPNSLGVPPGFVCKQLIRSANTPISLAHRGTRLAVMGSTSRPKALFYAPSAFNPLCSALCHPLPSVSGRVPRSTLHPS